MIAAVIAGAYLIGSIPFALILSRRWGADLRSVGSGNMGAANVMRASGVTAGVLVAALDRLLANLTAHPPPLSLLSQYLPQQAERARSGMLSSSPVELIRNKILEVLDVYAAACGTHALNVNGAHHAE